MIAAGSTLARRFLLQRRLGSGGMGEVFEAIDRDRGETVALKTLVHADGDTLMRFKREFRALQSTAHPNLVSLRELVRDGDRWFFTMELVAGRHLLEHVGRDAERLRAVLPQLVRALRVLHDAGLVHRDIKPSNVMVTDEGRVVVLDFGLVTTTDPTGQTTEGRAIGTIDYMAPEQAVGRKVTPAADWYAMGVMMYEALTGQLPFTGHALQIMVAKQQTEVRSPAELAPEAPADLVELCLQLLRIEPGARLDGAEIARRLGIADEAPARATLTSTGSGQAVFVGRAREVAELADSLAHARERAQVHLVIGESGIGKSELVARFCDQVTSSDAAALVLRGRCYERESVPYKALDGVVDGVTEHLLHLEPAQLTAVLPPRSALLVRMFPMFRRVEAIASARLSHDDAGEPQEQRRRVFGALRALLVNIAAERPVVVTIDDLQWADTDSFLLLRELLRGADAPRVLVVATVRDAEDEGAVSVARIEDRLAGVAIRRTALGPLSEDESRALAERLAPEVAGRVDVARLAREAGGHPMFLCELLRHLDTGAATATLDDALWARVGLLRGDALGLLEVICLAGAPIALDVASAASGLGGTALARAVASLRVASLAREIQRGRGLALEPYHDRVREAVAGRLGLERRVVLHARLAVALEQSEGARDLQLLLRHFSLAGMVERAAVYAEEAAQHSLDAHAFDQAAALWRSALELVPRDEDDRRRLRLRLGEALIAAGRGAEAADVYEAAAEGADRATRLACHRHVAEQLLISGRIERGVAALQSLLREIGVPAPSSPRAVLASLLRGRLRLRLRGLGFKPRERSEVTDADVLRLDVLGVASTGLSVVDTLRGSDFQTRQLLLALASGHRPHIARAMFLEGMYQANLDHRARAWELLERAGALVAPGDRYLNAMRSSGAGIAHYVGGDAPGALEHLLQGEALMRQVPGTSWELDSIQLFVIFVMRNLGDYGATRLRYDQYLAEAEQRGDQFLSSTVRRACVPMWLAEDDPDGAVVDLGRATWVPITDGFHVQHFHELLGRAEIALYRGDLDATTALEGEFRRLEGSLLMRVASIRNQTDFLRGRIALLAGDRRAAQRRARRCERWDVATTRVWALCLRAGAARLAGRADEELTLLAQANEAARAAGMMLVAAAARHRSAARRDDAAALAAADADLRALGIRAPARMVAMLLPDPVER